MGHAPGARHMHYGGKLGIAMGASAIILLVELWGAWRTGSLALLSDAGHVLTDLSGLLLAYLALRFADRPATPKASYGFYRLEVLAALANGILLAGVVVFLLVQAVRRLQQPLPSLDTTIVLVVAVVGLGVNILAALLLRQSAQENINAQGALWAVIGDAVASVGVILSALLVRFTGDVVWDTLVTFLVAAIISWGAFLLIRSTVVILLEAVPSHMDLDEVRATVEGVPGVLDVHDLHVWTLTPGKYSASMHVGIEPERMPEFHRVSHAIERLLEQRYGLIHSTIQIEPPGEGHASEEHDPVRHHITGQRE